MTTAQIIEFPVNRISNVNPLDLRMAGSAQIIIFPGDRWERLEAKQFHATRTASGKPRKTKQTN